MYKAGVIALSVALIGTAAAGGVVAKEKITYWTFAPSLTEKLVPQFEKENPDIDVEVVPMDFASLHEKLLVSLVAGTAPDVAMVEIQYISRVVDEAGHLLADLLKPPFNAGRYQKDFVPYKWQQGMTRGRLVAFPWDIAPAGLFYRRSIFANAGFDPEPEAIWRVMQTWDDFIKVGRKIYRDENGDNKPERFIIGDPRAISRVAISQTGIPLVDENDRVRIDDEEMIRAVQAGRDVREAGIDGISVIGWQWSEQWYGSLANGQAATEIMGSWFEGTLKERAPHTAGDWGLAPTPGSAGVNSGGSFLAITGASTHKEAAWRFVQFVVANRNSVNLMLREHGVFPAYRPAWSDAIYDEPVAFFGGERVRRMLIKIAEMTPPIFTHALDRAAWDVLNDTEKNNWTGYITKAVFGQMPVRAAMQSAAREVRALVAEWQAKKQQKR